MLCFDHITHVIVMAMCSLASIIYIYSAASSYAALEADIGPYHDMIFNYCVCDELQLRIMKVRLDNFNNIS